MLISLGKLCQLFNTVLITLLISVYFQDIMSYRREKNVPITKNKFVILYHNLVSRTLFPGFEGGISAIAWRRDCLYQVNQTFKACACLPTMLYTGEAPPERDIFFRI